LDCAFDPDGTSDSIATTSMKRQFIISLHSNPINLE